MAPMLRQSEEQHASGLPNGELTYGTRAGARSDPSNRGFGLDIRCSGHRVADRLVTWGLVDGQAVPVKLGTVGGQWADSGRTVGGQWADSGREGGRGGGPVLLTFLRRSVPGQ